MIFWLVLKLQISYIKLWYLEGFWFLLKGFFWKLYLFCMLKYLNFHNFFFAFKILFNVNGKATVWHTSHPLLLLLAPPTPHMFQPPPLPIPSNPRRWMPGGHVWVPEMINQSSQSQIHDSCRNLSSSALSSSSFFFFFLHIIKILNPKL